MNDEPGDTVHDAALYLLDDIRARRWAPFTLTRPAGELLLGCMTLRERAERVLGHRCAGHLTRLALAGYDEPGSAPVVELAGVGPDRTRILLLSRAALAEAPPGELPAPSRLEVEGQAVNSPSL